MKHTHFWALLSISNSYLPQQLYSSAQLYPEVLSVDNVEAIQAILCYAIYSLRSPKGPSLWQVMPPDGNS